MRNRILAVILAVTTVGTAAVAQPIFQWVRPMTGWSYDEARSIALGPDGDVHMTGVFLDSLIIPGSDTLQGLKNYDVVVGRYSKLGAFRNAVAFGGNDYDDARSIVVDKDGNVYIAGSYADQAFIGSELVSSYDDAGSVDAFVTKFDRFGAQRWVKSFGSAEYDEGSPMLACDSVGNVYVAGGFAGVAHFDDKTLESSSSQYDTYLAKLNGQTGDIIWLQRGGGSRNDEPLGLAATANGDRIYMVGTFQGFGQWGLTRLEGPNDKMDFFMLAYGSDGNVLWGKRAGYTEDDRYITCAADRSGNLLITGALNRSMSFGEVSISADGEFEPDLFLGRFGKDGQLQFLRRYGGIESEIGLGVAADAKNNIYVCGTFRGETNIEGNAFFSNGAADGFVMRLRSNGDYDWFRSIGGRYDDAIASVAVDAANIPYVCGYYNGTVDFTGTMVEGEAQTDIFVAALECGPNTALRPALDSLFICLGADSLLRAPSIYPAYQWTVDGVVSSVTTSVFDLSGLAEGTHTLKVRITDDSDCSLDSRTVTVVVTAGMEKPVVSREDATLRSSITDGLRYEWFRNGNRIGATGADCPIQGDGSYYVRVTDSSGCVRKSDPLQVGPASSISVTDATNGVRLYPNPTSGDITLEGLLPGARILIVDALGRTLRNETATTDAHTIGMGEYTNGLYTVLIQNGPTSIMRPVLKH